MTEQLMEKRTAIVNCFGAPGTGKSTMSGGLFNKLKTAGRNVEYIQEFAKTLTWERNSIALSNQFYVSGTQTYAQNMLVGQVEAIITDSPILLGLMYYQESNPTIYHHFKMFLIETFKAQSNINFVLTRQMEYNPIGRNHTERESDDIALGIVKLLKEHNIDYTEVEGNDRGMVQAYNTIIQELNT